MPVIILKERENLKKFLKFFLTILIIVPFLPSMVYADVNAVNNARNGVVRILVISPDGNSVSTGSGFAVGAVGQPAQYFVTNCHVAGENPEMVFIILDNIKNKSSVIQAKVVYLSESPDLAILYVDTPIKERTPLPLLSSKYVKPSEEVYALGFPGVSDELNDNGNSIPSTINDITITKGIISKVDFTGNGTECYQTDTPITHGNSGGPLINSNGSVIGINTFGSTEFQSTNGSIHIDYIMNILDQNKIPYTKGNDSSPQLGISTSTIIIIAVIVAAIGAAVIILNKRRGNATYPSTPESFADKPVSPVNHYMPPPQLVCTQGVFAGNTFEIRKNINIGRDPKRCQIVFPDSTQGISALHCEVQMNGDHVLLVDRGSSYGTYVSGGIKLTPNEPHILQRGETFYLASHKNEFKLM